jgi:chromosome segregation ATPase
MENQDNVNSVNTETASKQESEAFVSKKAYEDVSKDMHKYKAQMKDLQAALNEYQTKVKSIEEEKLVEQQRWKELYEKRTSELEQKEKEAKDKEVRYLKSLKMVELKKEIGANIRDEYLVHANINAIEFNEDGSLNKESLVTVANDFRQKHGQLIPKSENFSITGHAASNGEVTPPKSLNEMTMAEKFALLSQVKKTK